ncbi:MAG: hypothetical protein PUP92_21280 [Rhizonema sp. PD38]|nr:hypothetical protein [Rhizonema sp. PD38]
MMNPPVCSRHLQLYIKLAALFLDEFESFYNPNTGGLNYRTKLTHLHIPILQRLRAAVWANGFSHTERDLAQNPNKYRGLTDEYSNSSTETEVQSKSNYQRDEEEIPRQTVEA